jgi:hypothetical protein
MSHREKAIVRRSDIKVLAADNEGRGFASDNPKIRPTPDQELADGKWTSPVTLNVDDAYLQCGSVIGCALEPAKARATWRRVIVSDEFRGGQDIVVEAW